MKQLGILAFLIICSSLLSAQQTSTYKDTVIAVTNEEFWIPKDYFEVKEGVTEIEKYNIEVFELNSDTEVLLKDTLSFRTKSLLIPTNEKLMKKVAANKGHGSVSLAHVDCRAFKPGTYVVKTTFSGWGEKFEGKRPSYTKTFSYLVRVNDPTFASPVAIDSVYYVGEKATVSFATNEFKDFNLYSWKIFDKDNRVVIAGNGPVVKLDTLFYPEKIGDYTLKGYYNNQEFSYTDPQANTVHHSSWPFIVSGSLALRDMSLWMTKEDEEGVNNDIPVLDVSKNTYWNSRVFKFDYNVLKGDKIIILRPEITDFEVETEPKGLIKKKIEPYDAGMFKVLEFEINPGFFSKRGLEGAKDVTLTLSFDTQFGSETKTYKAKLFKSRN